MTATLSVASPRTGRFRECSKASFSLLNLCDITVVAVVVDCLLSSYYVYITFTDFECSRIQHARQPAATVVPDSSAQPNQCTQIGGCASAGGGGAERPVSCEIGAVWYPIWTVYKHNVSSVHWRQRLSLIGTACARPRTSQCRYPR